MELEARGDVQLHNPNNDQLIIKREGGYFAYDYEWMDYYPELIFNDKMDKDQLESVMIKDKFFQCHKPYRHIARLFVKDRLTEA